MTVPFTTQSLQDALTAKLALNFGTEPGEATNQEMLKACALVLRDVMALRGVQTAKETKKEQEKAGPLSLSGISHGPEPDRKTLTIWACCPN